MPASSAGMLASSIRRKQVDDETGKSYEVDVLVGTTIDLFGFGSKMSA